MTDSDTQHGYKLRNRAELDGAHGMKGNTVSACTSDKKQKRKKTRSQNTPSPSQPSMMDFCKVDSAAKPKSSRKKLEFSSQSEARNLPLNSLQMENTNGSQDVSPLTSPLNKLEAASDELNKNIRTIDAMKNNMASSTSMISRNVDMHAKALTPLKRVDTVNARATIDPTLQQVLMQSANALQQQRLDEGGRINRARVNTAATDASSMANMQFIPQDDQQAFCNRNEFMALPQHTFRVSPPGQQHINVATVYNMFVDLTQKMDQVQKTLNSLNESKEVFTGQIRGLQHDAALQEEKLQEISQQQVETTDKVQVISHVTSTLEHEVNDLKERLLKLEQKSMQKKCNY